jgi:adenylate cyclase
MILGNWGGRVALTSIVVSGLLLVLKQLSVFQGVELRTYDALIRMRNERKVDDRLLVVRITEPDLKRLQEPFVYDDTLAQAMNKLQQDQAKVIGIDIDRSIPMPKGVARKALAQELEQPNVVAVCALSGVNADEEGSPPPPEISEDQVGFVDFPEDPDGVTRRSLLSVPPPLSEQPHSTTHLCNDPNSGELPSFALITSIIYLEYLNKSIEPTNEENPRIKIGETIVDRLEGNSGGYQLSEEDMAGYSILLDYRNPTSISNRVTLGDLLDNKVDPSLVKDKIVLIGYDTIAIPDTFLTPYSAGSRDEKAKMPGVMVHAQVVSQILSIALDGQKPIGYISEPLEWLWLIAWSVIGGLLTFRGFKQLWLVGIVELGVIALFVVTVMMAMSSFSLWLPVISPLCGLILTAIGMILIDRVPTVQKLLKINIEIDWEKVRQEADKLVSVSGGTMTHQTVDVISTEDLEAAEQKAKQSYLEELQQRAKERRKKKHIPSAENLAIAPPQAIETEPNFFSRLHQQIDQLKQRLSSRRGREQAKLETNNALGIETSGQTLEQQAEMEQLEHYIEEVLQRARLVRQKSS